VGGIDLQTGHSDPGILKDALQQPPHDSDDRYVSSGGFTTDPSLPSIRARTSPRPA